MLIDLDCTAFWLNRIDTQLVLAVFTFLFIYLHLYFFIYLSFNVSVIELIEP